MFETGRRSRCFVFVFVSICSILMLSSCTARIAETAGPEEDDGAALCLSFLASYGWKTEDAPCEISQVLFPERFDAVYVAYNELQRAQGFDLAPYCGRYAEKYVFRLTEYPGAEDTEGLRATVFICGGRVIGGDISSTALDGFMHGIIPEELHNGHDQTR